MAGYIRQSTFVDGDTITAALFNNEYNQLVNAFSNTSGHKHDGTTAEGPVIGLIGDAGETSPNNKVLIDTTNNYIEFYVEVSSAPVQQLYIADGAIIPVTDSDIDLGTTSLRFKDTYTDTVTTTGNVSIGGDLTVTGSATISGNLTFGDADTDSINLAAEIDSDIIPNTDGTYDLGSATKEWQDLYIDGTANIDSLVADTADINGGTIDGATIATSDITVGAGKTLDVSSGTLTLADDQISGDKVEGGTIAATTITDLTFGSLNDGTITITAFADEDDMSSNSATLVPTQQSVKAYVDSQVTAQDLDITTDSGTIAIDLDSETLTVSGGTGLDSSATGNAVTLAIDSTVTTLTGTQTLTNKTLTSPVINTGVSGTAFLDDDTFATATATTLASSESIKAYVDTTVAATNEVVEDSTPQLGGDLDLNSNDIIGTGNINNTGTITTDGLTVDGTNGAYTIGSTGNDFYYGRNGTNYHIANTTNGAFNFLTGASSANRLNIANNGDISFYEDTGTTAQMTWDASADALTFTNNTKAVFGAGSELEVYFDGFTAWFDNTDSVTKDTQIKVKDGGYISLKAGSDNMIQAAGNSNVSLYYDGSPKLATTSTGIDVTGTVVSDGLTVDGNARIEELGAIAKLTLERGGSQNNADSAAVDLIETNAGSEGANFGDAATNGFRLKLDGSANDFLIQSSASGTVRTRLGIDRDTGDISFYEDTGTSQALFWDASAESLGIGTTSPSAPIDIKSTNSTSIKWQRTGVSAKEWGFVSDNDQTYLYNFTDSVISTSFANNGNVGIGTSSPASKLSIENTGSSTVDAITLDWEHLSTTTNIEQRIQWRFGDDATADTFLNAGYIGVGKQGSWQSGAGRDSYLSFGTTNDNTQTEAMRIDSTGNVGIGTASPASKLEVRGSGTSPIVYFGNGVDNPPNRQLAFSGGSSGLVWDLDATGASGVAGQLTLSTNGSEAMRIDSSGNVGIGKTSPAAELDVFASSTPAVRVADGSGFNIRLEAFGSNTAGLVCAGGATNMTFQTNETERMRIDASGNVGIGTTDPTVASGNGLAIYDSVVPRVQLRNSTSGDASTDGAGIFMSGSDLGIENRESSNIIFYNNTEKMRIDSSGNLLVGKTSAGLGTTGVEASSGGYIRATRNGNSLTLNRISTDGNLATFTKDGSTVGSIGSRSGATLGVVLNPTSSTGAGLSGASNSIIGIDETITPVDGEISLGTTSTRFKDLYLSENVDIDGAANPRIKIRSNSDTGTSQINFGDPTSATVGRLGYEHSSNSMVAYTNNAERMRIDAAGNVGIGTTSPGRLLELYGTSNPALRLNNGTDTTDIAIATSAGAIATGSLNNALVISRNGANAINLATNGNVRATIDSSGNVGIGTTSPQERLQVYNSSGTDVLTVSAATATANTTGASLLFRNLSSSATGAISKIGIETGSAIDRGSLVFSTSSSSNSPAERMRIDNSGNLLVDKTAIGLNTVGFEVRPNGIMASTRDGGSSAYFNRKTSDGSVVEFQKDGTTVGSIGTASSIMYIGTGDVGIRTNSISDTIEPFNTTNTNVRDALIDLGSSGARFKDIYATNGTIQTSDRNEKQDIEALTDAETRVAVAAKGLLRKFRWQSAVEEKGDEARIHFGIIAQDLQDAFTAEGLDAGDYAMFISSTWTDDDGVEQTRLGVRYSELLAFIIAAI